MNNSLGTFLRTLFPPLSSIEQPPDWRSRLVRFLLAGALIVGLLALVPAFSASWGVLTAVGLSAVYLLLSFIAIWRAPFRLQLLGLILIIYALGLAELLSSGNPANAIFYFLASVVFATMIWSLLAGAVTAAAALLTLGIVGILLQFGGPAGTPAVPVTDWIQSVVAILLAAIAMIAGFQQVQLEFSRAEKMASDAVRELQGERLALEKRVDARTLQWRTVLEVSRTASTIHDPDELTTEIVNLISDRFGFYYAAIFLLNEAGDKAMLHSATGEAGRLLKENRHSLPVGGRSMVGTAISTHQARIALETDSEAERFANPLLPYTRSEIAVPLVIGDRVLGALDVQSTSPGAFGPAEVETLQGMANQVAIAFENARLYQTARQSLEELQAIQRQYVASAWQPLGNRGDMEYSLGDEELSPSSAELEVPLALRDQIIGQISLSSEADWTPEQRNLVEAIATQAALALENARLVESTQSTAQREHLLADITGKVWSSPARDAILRTAIGELGSALGAERAVIEVSLEGAAGAITALEYTPSGVHPVRSRVAAPDGRGLQVPLELRGQQIGSISVSRSSLDVWTDADRDLAQKTAVQVALALENVRLLEETRERALQEQQLSELSARLSQSVDLDSLLQTAVRELANLPEVSDASVFLKTTTPEAELAHSPHGTRE